MRHRTRLRGPIGESIQSKQSITVSPKATGSNTLPGTPTIRPATRPTRHIAHMIAAAPFRSYTKATAGEATRASESPKARRSTRGRSASMAKEPRDLPRLCGVACQPPRGARVGDGRCRRVGEARRPHVGPHRGTMSPTPPTPTSPRGHGSGHARCSRVTATTWSPRVYQLLNLAWRSRSPSRSALGRRRARHQRARTAEVARRVRWIDVVTTIEFRSSWSFHIVALPE